MPQTSPPPAIDWAGQIKAGGGGLAIGAALAVLYTHGGDYAQAEVATLGAGAGALVTWAGRMIERFIAWLARPREAAPPASDASRRPAPIAGATPPPPPKK